MDSDLSAMLQSVLSNPDSIRSILSLAQALSSGESASEDSTRKQSETANSEQNSSIAAEEISDMSDSFEEKETISEKSNDNDVASSLPSSLSSLASIASIMSAGSDTAHSRPKSNVPELPTDNRIKLLMSLRPFLEERKQQRVDGLVKALGAAHLISQLKDTDIFKSFGL